MKRYKCYLPVVLSFLLVMSCMVPSGIYASEPSRDAQQKIKETPAAAEGMSLLSEGGLVFERNKTALELAQKIVGNAVTINNVTYAGIEVANGFFSGGSGIIGFEDGILLSTGDVNHVVGPNELTGSGISLGAAGDVDLSQLIDDAETYDATVLEFDFTPINNVISFTYVFASDEYNEYVNSVYNDVFGFFLNGKNVALVPGTQTAVSINNVNGGNPFGTNAMNPEYYRNNDLENGGGTINTEMDGLTTVLQVEASVTPGAINSIKLAIADVKDHYYDSVVFIKAGSFDDEPIDNTCIAPDCETLLSEGGFKASSPIGGGDVAYHIESPEQLAHINEHMDLDYIQTKEIDLDPDGVKYAWTPIGGYEEPGAFTGSYDGKGFEIKNMFLNHSTSGSSITAGLFAKASNDSHLENINLSINNVYLEREVPEGSLHGDVIIGGITGEHFPNYTIENCNVTIGSIVVLNEEGDIFVGGISGTNSGSISGCNTSFEDYVILGADYGYLYFGGITAYNEYDGIVDSSKSYLHNNIEIFGDEDFIYGGIVGDNSGMVSNCFSDSKSIIDVNLLGYENDPSGDSFIGGLCGYTAGIIENSGQDGVIDVNINSETNEQTSLKNATIDNSKNNETNIESNIYESNDDTNNTNDIYVGGIAGYVVPNYRIGFAVQETDFASIFNTDHTGNINVKSDNNEDYINIDNLNVGGIVGFVYSDATNLLLIENCQNDGSICSENSSGSSFSGGITGYIYQEKAEFALTEEEDYSTGVKILNCANHSSDAEVTANGTNEMGIAGGVVGASRFIPEAQPAIENCYNRSNVRSRLSFIDDEKINILETEKGYACEGSAAGGIIGASGGVNILATYSTADLVTSTAIAPTPSIAVSIMPTVLPVETQSGYAGGIAGLIWDTTFTQNYYEANGNVVNGIGGAVKETQQDEISVAAGYGNYEIVQPYSDSNVTSASAVQLKSKTFFGEEVWKWYASGSTAPQYYDSDSPWRMIAANTYPVLRGKLYSPSSPGGSSGGGSIVETPPPVAGLPAGTLIDRMPGYLALSDPLKINEVKSEITLSFDTDLLKNKSADKPRMYYWNADKKNWVALATYPVSNGKVRAVNDGKYKGWFVVFGVIQPDFSDIEKSWAEQTINRMNGLGMVEGYPSEDGSLLRNVLPDQQVTHAEFTMLISRLLNIDIDDPRLPLISKEDSLKILNENFTDGDKIPGWVLQAAGTLEKENILPGNGTEFQANTPITRIEAAVMISKAINLLKETEKADLSKFTDSGEIPDWAKGELIEGAMMGYPDNTFRPNGHLTRAEALTMLQRLFVEGLGW